MPYCTECGTRLPEDEEARFCPSCGTLLTPQAKHKKAEIKARRESRIATLGSRFALFVVILVFCFAVTSLGTLARVEPSEASEIVQEFDKLEEMLKVAGVPMIFGNNMMYCLMMSIPVLGPFLGSYVLYSTGRVLAAMGSAVGADPLLLFISLFIYPHAWIEYLSYSLAISESLWIPYLAVRRGTQGFRKELTSACKVIAICASLLLLAAFLEMSLISFAQA